MDGMTQQKIVFGLEAVLRDPRFKAVTDPAVDHECLIFGQLLTMAHSRFFTDYEPDDAEIRDRLARLDKLCVGELAQFRPAITTALALLTV
jgi:hypothetical protein